LPDIETRVITEDQPKAPTSPSSAIAGRTAWLAATLWFVGVTALSFLPYSAKLRLETRSVFHMPAHVLVFAGSALIAWRIVRRPISRLITYLAVIGYIVAIEFTQSWVNATQFEWDDLIADIAGVALALLAIWLYRARKGIHKISD
jgi:hypothetical protein